MGAVGLAAVAALSSVVSSDAGIVALKTQVDAQRQMVAALQALTSSGPGQIVNILV
jgi:hypothetical protein